LLSVNRHTESGNQIDEPEINSLLQELDRYEVAFHGLSVSVESVPENNSQTIIARSWISQNGGIRKAELQTISGSTTLYSGIICDFTNGWSISCSQAKPSIPGSESTSAILESVDRNNRDSITKLACTEVENGFIEGNTFYHFAQQCKKRIYNRQIHETNYWSLECDHPKFCSVSFLFDAELRLRLIELSFQPGDESGGALNVEPDKVPSGTWSRRTIGPIEYSRFFDRDLPVTIHSTFCTSGGAAGASTVRFIDYQMNEEDINSRISFSNIHLEEGMRVTKKGEHWIRHELRDGRVVKIVDSDAVAAADRARMGGFLQSRLAWYIGSGLLLVCAIFVLIWQRTRLHHEA
jgi:hypothetical protein